MARCQLYVGTTQQTVCCHFHRLDREYGSKHNVGDMLIVIVNHIVVICWDKRDDMLQGGGGINLESDQGKLGLRELIERSIWKVS